MITKVSLDAATGQVLAGIEHQRQHGEPPVLLLAELGGAYADQIADQFPGEQELAGRVLASAAVMLNRAADALPSADAPLLLALGFTAGALCRKAAR